jgi:UDP-N-acetylglucosamine:LPS N-acetylglucosamine transferase
MEDLIRILPEGIGVVITNINITTGKESEFRQQIPFYEERVAELAAAEVELIHPAGAPPFFILGYQGEQELIRGWEAKYKTPIMTNGTNQIAAMKALGIKSDLPVLLVLGGSKGARSINMAVLKHLTELLGVAQIIHITGSLDWSVVEKAAQELPSQLRSHYHIMPYSHEMGAALAAADLVLSRAGASTLGEYPLFGLPAVLVPYPYAWRYQKVNADFLAERNAAVILQDELLEDKLLSVVKDLLLNKHKLEAMSAAMKKLSHPNAATVIASQLLELAGGQLL